MIEVLTPAEMVEADRRAVAGGTKMADLMERAGYAVADVVAAEWPAGTRVAVLAGPGNNGGDAFVAARVLRRRGYAAGVVDLAGERPGDVAAAARAAWTGPAIAPDDPTLGHAAVIVDGLFGGGLSRDLDGAFAALIGRVDRLGASVVAIDLPSGIDGATGAVRGCAVTAQRTVTFARRKPGHLLMPGRAHAGRVTVADIGIRDSVIASLGATTFENAPALWRHARPVLADAGHKYDRGHVAVVSGPMAATGAARLAALAAARTGAGLVTVASPSDALLVNAIHLTSVMVRRVDGPDDLEALARERKVDAIVLGPGLPPDERARAMTAAALAHPAVLDAGALIAFAGAGRGGAERLAGIVAGRPCVLTPHPGEFARLFPDLPGGKPERTRAAAAATGAVVLHKGADTVIAAPDGRAAINANAPPWLATAGAGDVLAGIVAALLGQGVAPFEAAAMAAFLHGDAARRAGPAMIAEDLVAALKGARAAFDAV